MLEIVVDRGSDLEDIDNIVKYLKKFVKIDNIDIEGRHIDVTFNKDARLAKLINRLGADKVEKQISDDLESYGGAGVVIHSPDADSKPDMIGNLGQEDEEYSETDEEDVEDKTDDSDFDKLAAEYLDIILTGAPAFAAATAIYVFNAFCVGILESDGVAPPSAESLVTSHPNVIACPNVFPI
jgi:hypothetical protein